MGFYQEISKYYDYIFPVSNEIVDFIGRTAGNPPKSILDVACGTGGYSIELADKGYEVTAVDLDREMIESLNAKKNSKVKFFQGDMLRLKDKLNPRSFDTIFCIGNSLVHLDNLSHIGNFFADSKGILKEDGSLIIQTINYDRVISKEVKSLPTIYNNDIGLLFERVYRYDKEANKVYFKTVLTVGNNKIQNEIPLHPLLFSETQKILMDAGFKKIDFYGDFKNNIYEKDNSYMLIIHAKLFA